jgi:hypothetical protein
MLRLSKLTLLLCFFALFSCVQNDKIDFTQVDNFKLNQQIKGSLLSLKASLPDFGDINNLPFTTYELNSPIDVFNDATIQNELVKVTFKFWFDNTFNRDFEFVFNFLDTNDNLVYSTTVLVNKLAVTNKDVIVEGIDLVNLKTAIKTNIVISLLNSTSIDNTLGAALSINFNATLDLSTGNQVTASLVSLDVSLPDFTDVDNLPFTTFDFDTPLDVFNNSTIQSKLDKVEVHFEIENTFNRDFEFLFEFVDANNNVVYSIPIILDKTSKTIEDDLIEGVDLENLKKSKNAKVHVVVLNATTIDNTPGAFINLKSSVTFFF